MTGTPPANCTSSEGKQCGRTEPDLYHVAQAGARRRLRRRLSAWPSDAIKPIVP